MIIIPAIDVKDGKCVRLRQGDFSRVTVYSADPAEMARKWRDMGAQRIHVVDLDGSREGRPVNAGAIRLILEDAGVPVEVGGGIRNMETVETYLGMGAGWVILGTSALKDGDFLREACRRYPGRIILGIDAKDGNVAVEGWTENTDRSAASLAKKYEEIGLHAIVYTDIMRDGMETGVNVEATVKIAESVNIPIIASGGVSGIRDIERLAEIADPRIIGVITGKALYTGALDLREAIRASQGKFIQSS
ncbi:MAG: 1-(5-phosphoribosyl)-5-[(5-phosphoribosylamino)methylideneamino]imidazole-4-carboxamide isomerase [Syntrophales bacterium]|nr:1-(5-phosphoribosyl)-5-[(5-phosphoribosylamino)methylideneamino]imidazole-4-carboxamide isomerase [Syntrophales bacterium]MDD5531875.1 1-(5-phosphoribosyl)-5-[(5-phosphoribosylamino)methylideneamino]imidazole-4-carboxamide isomerase [Syntrophales bacterium]